MYLVLPGSGVILRHCNFVATLWVTSILPARRAGLTTCWRAQAANGAARRCLLASRVASPFWRLLRGRATPWSWPSRGCSGQEREMGLALQAYFFSFLSRFRVDFESISRLNSLSPPNRLLQTRQVRRRTRCPSSQARKPQNSVWSWCHRLCDLQSCWPRRCCDNLRDQLC